MTQQKKVLFLSNIINDINIIIGMVRFQNIILYVDFQVKFALVVNIK